MFYSHVLTNDVLSDLIFLLPGIQIVHIDILCPCALTSDVQIDYEKKKKMWNNYQK